MAQKELHLKIYGVYGKSDRWRQLEILKMSAKKKNYNKRDVFNKA